MRKIAKGVAIALLSTALYQCGQKQEVKEPQKEVSIVKLSGESIAVDWNLVRNQCDVDSTGKRLDHYKAIFTFTNNSEEDLTNKGWTLYMNRLPRKLLKVSDSIRFEKISGDYYKITPTDKFPTVKKGESIALEYVAELWAFKESDAPCGLYFVFENEKGEELEPTAVTTMTIQPIVSKEQMTISGADNIPVPTTESIFDENQVNLVSKLEKVSPIIPTPNTVEYGKEAVEFSANLQIVAPADLKAEAEYLQSALKVAFTKEFSIVEKAEEGKAAIVLGKGELSSSKKAEAYHLDVKKGKGVVITGNDNAGVFYAIQSLLKLVPAAAYQTKVEKISINEIFVADAPRFPYRGMHLDLGRNFHSKESVLKLLDIMASYKLNKFHYHFCDDEGWRLEIPSLPELTEIGSKRGHTKDEKDMLYPAYGSGPYADATKSNGTGFHSRADFIEILKYATVRHIEVVPEFDVPGHARAAIKAMDVRYDRFAAKGDTVKAEEFLLRDVQDASEYLSVQHYTDNVICICKPSATKFIKTVVADLVAMYKEAEAPLTTMHTGGDEVPHGVWTKSPECEQFFAQNEKLNHDVKLLQTDFLRRMSNILAEYDVTLAGWEEIALHITQKDGKEVKVINPEFAGKFQPYVWNSVFGWGNEDLGYKLANQGYPIVLSNVTNLYFDLAYSKDSKENGYYWGGLVDTKKAYEFAPYDLYKVARFDRWGNPIDPKTGFKGKKQLTATGKKNVLGIQGQLWSETVKGQEMMESYIMPRLLGLAERAWTAQPKWVSIQEVAPREAALNKEWNMFVNTLGQQELPRLDYQFGGVGYRVPLVGAKVIDGKVNANIVFAGLTIRYTTDGSEPTKDSKEYTTPFDATTGTIKFKAFTKNNRESRTSVLVVK